MLARSYNTAVPFAEDLVASGVRIFAKPATPLCDLVGLSSPLDFDGRAPEIEVPGTDTAVATHSNTGCELDSNTCGEFGQRWGLSFEDYGDQLVRSLNVQISYIRNTIVPRVVEFSNEALAFIEGLGRTDASKDLEIYRASLPELASDQSFLATLESYKFKRVTKPGNTSLNLPFKAAPDDFLKVASLSNNRLDGLVAAWASSTQVNYLEMVWHSFFSDQSLKTYGGNYINSDDFNSPDMHHRFNVTLAYFLIANYYNSHSPDVVVNETVESLNRRLYDHLLYAGVLVTNSLERISASLASNVMVCHVDSFHKRITVAAELYDKWLASGGSPDVMLGMLVSDRRFYTVDEVNKNSDSLKAAWNGHIRYTIELVEMNKAKTLRAFYRGQLTKYMQAAFQDEVERGYLITAPYFVDTLDKKAEEYLYRLKAPELQNVQVVARELIAGMKYSYTYASKFISDMEEIGLHTENVDPAEAALMATVNYIVDHLLGQIGSVNA